MVKRKPIPVTTTKEAPDKSQKKKFRSTRQLINKFHEINKKLNATQDGDLKSKLSKQLDELGGLHCYQKASLKGASKGGGYSSAWLFNSLKEKQLLPTTGQSKLTLLDVGSICGNIYDKYNKYISPVLIDLNPQTPGVIKQDFFELEISAESQPYDIVCLSLVVNFVPDAKLRGDMLIRTRKFLKENGFLFLVLPVACIANSRYFTEMRLLELLASLGYSPIHSHQSSSLYYLLCQENNEVSKERIPLREFYKEELNPGAKRNNFTIVLKQRN